MSRILWFVRSTPGRWTLAGLLLALFFLSWWLRPEPRLSSEILGDPQRLTQGAFHDGDPRFDPRSARLVFSREPSEDAQTPESQLSGDEPRVIVLDYKRPTRPKEHEIEALRGASWPSFLGEKGYAALDTKGRLITLEDESAEPHDVILRNFAGHPAKPVASPDGRHIAFLATALPLPADGAVPPTLDIFRYEAYVVAAEGGIVRAVTKPFAKSARMVSVAWADADRLLVTYQILDEHNDWSRVERVDIHSGARRLVIFTDFSTPLSPLPGGDFFATALPKEQAVAFIWRDDSREARQFIRSKISGIWLEPSGERAVVRWQSEHGDNLSLLPVPEAFRRPPGSRPEP